MGLPNVTAGGLSVLVESLPRMPRLISQEAQYEWKDRRKVMFRLFWYCAQCNHIGKEAASVNMYCKDCFHGALCVPKELQHTPEGGLLTDAWALGGRAVDQLRWC